MAMTKKEQAAMAAAIERAELVAALRWTAPVDYDVMPPTKGYREGWTFNSWNRDVRREWSGVTCHGSGDPPTNNEERHFSASQNSQKMFSTEALALAALRHELELKYASDLLEIDRRLKALK